MRAAVIERFGIAPVIRDVADPEPPPGGVVVRVHATGICRSDWHGWMGHDEAITLPHVPGHEFAGEVVALGDGVRGVGVGELVTVPFVAGCGRCRQCAAGHQQVCEAQEQPGFTYWGSFAELVAVHRAETNLVRLPEGIDAAAAASLGCRFATSFRAVVDVGRATAGEWVAVHGCGGVGLSAVMIASALGARVVAVDLDRRALELAGSVGADATIDGSATEDPAEAVREITGGGAHVSLDAVGSPGTCRDSVRCLRTRGRHVQVGLLVADAAETPLPMDRVIAGELAILGSHGMQAHRYEAMLSMIVSGRLAPERLVGREVDLASGVEVLTSMAERPAPGVTVITSF